MPNKDPEKDKAVRKVYRERPEIREKRAVYNKAYQQRPEVKEKSRVRGRAYHQRPGPKEKDRRCVRNFNLKKKYGLTQESFAALLAGQGSVCAACGFSDWGSLGPVVDHNHDSGVIRGILCHACNTAAGMLKDDPTRARALADYLEPEKKGKQT